MKHLLIILLTVTYVKSIILTRCELVRELKKNGFADVLMPSWVCLVETESGRNTALKTPQTGGTTKWGLFQLANPKYCTPGVAGGMCKIKCEDMILDDITKSSKCASLVYVNEGFKAWPGWVSSCQSNLPSLDNCSVTKRETSLQTLIRKLREKPIIGAVAG